MAFAPTYAAVGDNKLDIYGATEVGIWTITFSGADTYVTGGLALVAATFGLSRPIASMVPLGGNTAALVFQPYWNTQTQKLQLLEVNVGVASTPAPLQDVASGASIANFQYQFLIVTQR